MIFLCFPLFHLSPEQRLDFQETASSSSNPGTTSSASPLLDVTTNSPLEPLASDDIVILELKTCSSDDTVILEGDLSPARKRQKTDDDAKNVS